MYRRKDFAARLRAAVAHLECRTTVEADAGLADLQQRTADSTGPSAAGDLPLEPGHRDGQ